MCADVKVVKRDDENKKEGKDRRGDYGLTFNDMVNRFFDDSSFDPFSSLRSMFPALPNRFTGIAFPKVDISETDDELKIVANIPGVDPDKIEIEVHDGILSLSGSVEKESEDKDKDKKYYRYEREYGEFRREFILPRKVVADQISAKAKNGVLTITIPKAEEEKKKKVTVQAE